MTDLELLDLAAQAAGVKVIPRTWDVGAPWGEHHGFVVDGGGPDEWNPLQDRSEAIGLALKLRMSIVITALGPSARAEDRTKWSDEHIAAGEDCGAALCRAIVRAAAACAPVRP